MTYLVDGRYIQDHFPGIGRYALNLADALARVAPHEQFRVLYDPHLQNTRFDLNRLAGRPNLELVRVAAPTFSLREQFLGWDQRASAKSALWHSVYYLMPYLLPMPAVVTLSDVTPLVRQEEMPSAAKRLLYRALNLVAANRAAQVITLSEASAADIRRVLGLPGRKLTVVPLAADPQFRPLDPAEREQARAHLGLAARYVLYVGSNKPHKNLVRLVQAWARVPTDMPLIVAGHWDPRFPEAARRVEEMGLGNRVRFVRNPGAELPSLVGGAELFVFPSVHEGFGLPPLEAMASGTPVACASASSLPEVVGAAAVLFDPFDVESIASALTRTLDDATLRVELRARGLAQAARFTWERTALETLRVYQKVVGMTGRERVN